MLEKILVYFAVTSIIAFFVYGIDKRKAQKSRWRISEKALLCLSFFGGALGGYLGMKVFRHKTKHWYFHVVHILAFVWQIALCIYVAKG